MIGPGAGARVMVATRPVDFRKGADSLAALVGVEYLSRARTFILSGNSHPLPCRKWIMGDSLPRLSHVDAPFARHRMMPDRRDVALEEEEHMTDVYILAIDLAKRSFQVCATAVGGAVLFNRMVSRAKLETVLREQAPCIVAMEASATSHFWERFAQGLGHEVRLIPPIYAKPFVKRQKNDAADAAAIAEAALRSNLH